MPAKAKLNSESVAGVATTKILICGPISTYWVPKDTKLTMKNFRDVLTPEELQHSEEITAKTRRDEFLRARWLFHRSFKNAGSLIPDKDGLSTWPEGWVGSISHKNGHVLLAKASKSSHESIGIDLEAIKAIKPGFENKISSEAEQNLVEHYLRDPKLDRSEIYLKIFSAKEALFKAHYLLEKKRFDFLDVEVTGINFIRREVRMKLKIDTSSKTKNGQSVVAYYTYLPSSDGQRYIVTTCEERISTVVEIAEEEEDELLKDSAS